MPINRSPSRNGEAHGSEDQASQPNMEAARQPQGPAIHKVAVRAPPFWPEEPALWFAQLEGQFILGGITQDNTKFAHVLSQLDAKYAREVKDIITGPPGENKYLAIKDALIQRLSASQEQHTRQLLEHEELGDRKPSQFLRHLQTLAGTTVPEQLLRILWLGRLPTQMQVILATRTQDRLQEVAEQADRIHEVSSRTIAEVSTANGSELSEQVAALTRQISEMDRRWRNMTRPHHRRPRSKSRDRKQYREMCFYHKKFGVKAKRCEKPCNFKQPKEQGDR